MNWGTLGPLGREEYPFWSVPLGFLYQWDVLTWTY